MHGVGLYMSFSTVFQSYQDYGRPNKIKGNVQTWPYEPAHEIMYLSHRRPAMAQASLRIHTVSPEPSLFIHIKYESKRRVQPKNQISNLTGWLRVHVSRMSLRRTKRAIISWDGSIIVLIVTLNNNSMNQSFKEFRSIHVSHVMIKPDFALCKQQRQSDQHLCCSLPA